MKYLICSGVGLNTNPSIRDIVTIKSEVGGNIGNLLFINAVMQSLCLTGEEVFTPTHYKSFFSDEEIEKINSEYDAFILPLADAFRDDNIIQLKNYTHTVKRLKIPCVIVGVGLRAEYDADIDAPRAFDDAAKEFISAILERSNCVGLRGEVTGRYLKRLGFIEGQDYMPIGCPSMCMATLGSGIRIRDVNTIENISISGNDLSPDNVKEMLCRVVDDYPRSNIVQQRVSEMADVYLEKYSYYRRSKSRVPGEFYGKEKYEYLLKQKRIKYFSNIYHWVEFLSKMDFCINTRFHGNVVSVMAGTPSIIIPIDSRMQELVDYHQLPFIPANKIKPDESIEDLISRVNLHSSEAVAEKNLNNYFSFLKKNNLHHVNRNYQPSYMIENPYNIKWRASEPFFTELNKIQRVTRVLGYYLDKAKIKLALQLKGNIEL